jgi:hypothetical protein
VCFCVKESFNLATVLSCYYMSQADVMSSLSEPFYGGRD